MALDLIFTRARTSDAPVSFDDVPINTRSLMIDVDSLAQTVRSLAGWVYPQRKGGPSSFERGVGTRVLFGKNRRIFDDFPFPYSLQFYPARGIDVYQFSVYSGEYQDVPSLNGLPVPGTNYRVRLNRAVNNGQLQRSLQGSNVWEPVRDDQIVKSAGLGPDGRIDCLLGDGSTYVWTTVMGPYWQGSNKIWFDGLGDNLGRVYL